LGFPGGKRKKPIAVRNLGFPERKILRSLGAQRTKAPKCGGGFFGSRGARRANAPKCGGGGGLGVPKAHDVQKCPSGTGVSIQVRGWIWGSQGARRAEVPKWNRRKHPSAGRDMGLPCALRAKAPSAGG
jgi:hypothetical protein